MRERTAKKKEQSEELEKPKKKMNLLNKVKGKKDTSKFFLFSSIAAIAVAIVAFSAMAALKGKESIEINGYVYTEVNGVKVEWQDGVKLSHDEDGTVLKSEGKKIPMEEYPLIDKNGIITLQKTCSYNMVSDEKMMRLDYFTQIYSNAVGEPVIKRGNQKVVPDGGFIYDNKDTYIFLEPVKLMIGDEKLTLPPLSIVTANYLEHVAIFGPKTESYYKEIDTEEVVAIFDNGKRVSISSDKSFMDNGAWRLLFLPLEVLEAMV